LKAIKEGQLTRLPCRECGSTIAVEAHHEDYTKPLEVQWLCRKHHARRHAEMNDKLIEGTAIRVALDSEKHARLKAAAALRGKSIIEIVNEIIDKWLAKYPPVI
jgi:hypothetical protein